MLRPQCNASGAARRIRVIFGREFVGGRRSTKPRRTTGPLSHRAVTSGEGADAARAPSTGERIGGSRRTAGGCSRRSGTPWRPYRSTASRLSLAAPYRGPIDRELLARALDGLGFDVAWPRLAYQPSTGRHIAPRWRTVLSANGRKTSAVRDLTGRYPSRHAGQFATISFTKGVPARPGSGASARSRPGRRSRAACGRRCRWAVEVGAGAQLDGAAADAA
jgi:hypothetical protein